MNQTLRESSALPLVVFALMFACAAGWALGPRGVAAAGDTAPRRGRPEEVELTAEVYGRAVYEGTGRPVRRARVLLLNVEGVSSFEGLTDGQGEFRIRGVAAGRYLAVVDLPGLLSPLALFGWEEMRGGPPYDLGGAAKNFDVVEVDGKAAREVRVTARRGAALGGKVTYADGSPAVGAQIYVMRRAGGRLERVLTGFQRMETAGGRTDDRGAFRATGLPPGEYLVAVSEAATHGERDSSEGADYEVAEHNPSAGMTNLPFLVTFHPSAAGADDATVVTLGAGEEQEDVHISIAERELRQLSGVVRTRRDGRPLAGARLTILRRGEARTPSNEYAARGANRPNVTKTDEHGRWRLKDIPDGPYTVYVNPSDEYEPGAPEAPEVEDGANLNRNSNVTYTRPRRPKKRYAPAQQEVQVSAATGELNFELGEGGRISGTLAAESGRKPGAGSFVYLVRESGGGGRDYRHSSISGGEFSFEGLPAGEYSIHYHSLSYQQVGGALSYAKAITWEGKDLLRERVKVGEGAAVEGVRVLVSTEVATLRVSVKGDAKAVNGAHVFLMSAGPEGWSQHAQQYHCVTGNDGACEVGAAPGEYAVVVLPRVIGSLKSWEDEMKKRGTAAPRAVLRAGETKTLELALPGPR